MGQLNSWEQEQYLTTKEFAKLKGKHESTIRRMIQSGKIVAVRIKNESGGGKDGFFYLIPFDSLTEKEKRKYLKNKRITLLPSTQVPEDARTPKRIDEYSQDERKVIQQWIDAIQDWQRYRTNYRGQLSDADEMWVKTNISKYKDINLSVPNLYRKWKALRENDYDGLIDKRGKWAKGISKIPDVMWELFKYYYLDEARHPITQCYNLVKWYLEKEMPELLPELPAYDSFYRAVKTIPFAVVKLFREGNKAFEDQASPYITRMYEELEVNEVWVADAHTFDVMTIEIGTEKVHRLTVVAFADVRSRLIVGWHITNNTSSEAVLMALRKGIKEFGIPKYIYVDNGTEFLCFDIGGRGHRSRKKDEGDHIPPGVFARLGIKMWNAQVRNAKAKVIERIFREFKENFSRLVLGFCGGNPLEKPEKLKKILKTRKGMILDSSFKDAFGTYIKGMYNETPSNGLGMYGRCPIEVYEQELVEKRVAKADDLNLMLMRSTRMQKVGRKGVYIEICGEKLYYWTPEFVFNYSGRKEVYVRYDPDDLSEVRVYNEHDEYMCNLPVDRAQLPYGASKEDVKAAIHETRKVKKLAKEYMENSLIDKLSKFSDMDIMLWKARKNIEERQNKKVPEAKVLKVVRANEPISSDIEKKQEVEIDLQRMIQNSIRNVM
ncbi:MAG: Mu transposase C-terminal domain-containing protein [Firmicutes bacterium]|nr:Mu transposase C-terminal domain-containing protein [Bacillota bacterium]